jgi:hypothetical protein
MEQAHGTNRSLKKVSQKIDATRRCQINKKYFSFFSLFWESVWVNTPCGAKHSFQYCTC